jgi:hypothetical protein
MAKTVIALYDHLHDANAAIEELVDHGFAPGSISLMTSDATNEYSSYVGNADEAGAAGAGAGVGALVAGLGGLLVGIGALALPGIGPVVAAGPLATVVSGLIGAGIGAMVGGVTGGLIGALVELGVGEDEAEYYAEGVRRGGSLVAIEVEDQRADEARQILDGFGPVDLDERAEFWRKEGWTGFDDERDPYTSEEIDRERARYGSTTFEDELELYDDYDDDYDDFDDYDDEYDREVGFDQYDQVFRRHYENRYADLGYSYARYRPAYYYGYALAMDDHYTGWDWDQLEPEARRGWQESEDLEGEWENFVDAVHHAWLEVKANVNDALD